MAIVHDRLVEIMKNGLRLDDVTETMKKKDHYFNDAYDAFAAALQKWSERDSGCILTPMDTNVQYVTYGDIPDDWHAEVSTSPFKPTYICNYDSASNTFSFSPSDSITNTFRYSHSVGDQSMFVHYGDREAVGSEEPMYTTKYDEEAFQDRFWDMVHHVQEQTTCTTEEAKEFVLKMMTDPTLAYSPSPAREEELDTTEIEKHLEELLS